MKVYIDGKFYDEDKAKISVFDHGLLYGDGIITVRTLSAPRASTATARTSAESIPPDKPMIAPGNPFLPT